MVSAAEEGYAYDDLNIEFYGASEYNGETFTGGGKDLIKFLYFLAKI